MNVLPENFCYLATCNKCNLQYVGSTSTEFKVRFRNHKSSMLNNRRTCELAVHYNSLLYYIFLYIGIKEKIMTQTSDWSCSVILFWLFRLQRVRSKIKSQKSMYNRCATLHTTLYYQFSSLMVNRSAFADVDFAMCGTSSRSRLLKLWKSKFNNSSSAVKNGVVLLAE